MSIFAAIALWFVVLPEYGNYPTGRFIEYELGDGNGHVTRRVVEERLVIDEASSKGIVSSFDECIKTGAVYSVNIGHDTKNVVGKIDKLRLSPKGEVEARFRLSDEGMRLYVLGLFSSISPAFYSQRGLLTGTSKMTKLDSVALTNHPFLKRLKFKAVEVEIVND